MATGPNVALTGASGFVGRHVLARLLADGHRVRALARRPAALPAAAALEVVEGSLFDDAALAGLVRGVDAVVHLVGIIMEVPARGQTFDRVHALGARRLLDAAGAAGVRRWVQMSALGARPDAVSDYHRTKWQAECAVRDSPIACTIFRPSIIHGADGAFMEMVKGFWCNRFPPFVPFFGAGLLGRRGAGRLQPVWVEDVARCFTAALTGERTVNETYALGGPDVYTWPQLYAACRRHLPRARTKRIVAVPAWYARLVAGLPGVPFNRDQVVMSQEDSTCSNGKVRSDFDFEPAPFESTFAGYAGTIR